ncbi:MAG: hypothetical protein IJM63_01695 [Solobacterium sp.]|nr:hypothetical protein [Solobacterium sp.]
MKKLVLILCMMISCLCGGCASKPSRAADLYNGCIFVVKNGEITSYGVYIEVKERIRNFSVMNLRDYDESFADEYTSIQADTSRIYYRSATVYNACHKDGYGEKSYFAAATRPLYKISEEKYKKLISKLASATIEVELDDSKTDQKYRYNTVLPVVETAEVYE